MSPHIGVLGPKAQDIVNYFCLGEGEKKPQNPTFKILNQEAKCLCLMVKQNKKTTSQVNTSQKF